MQTVKYHFLISLVLSFFTLSNAVGSSSVKPVKKVKSVKFIIEKSKSTLGWKATKLKGQHVGQITITKGELIFVGGDLQKAEFNVNMKSMTVTDLKDPKWNKKLIDHLASKDFFDIANHKSAKLTTKSIKMAKGGNLDVIADLTIKGQTKPVTFKMKLEKKGSRFVKVSGKLIFDRTHYGITYKSGNFFQKLGDKLIHDPVELTFDIMAKSNL